MPSSSTEATLSANGSAATPAAAAESSSSQPATLSPMSSANDSPSPQASSTSPSSRPLTPAFAVQTAAASAPDSADDSHDHGQENTPHAEQPQQATTNQTPSPSAINDAAVSHSAQLSATSAVAAAEEMLALLSAKKRALLSEIGALLTLRERLHTEMRSDHEKGVPFDYAVRFAHSPSTLAALEAAADAFREQMREEGIHIAKTQRGTARSSSLMMSPGVHASTSAVAKSALAFAQPSAQEPEHPAYSGRALFDSSPIATPVQTPSKVRSKKTGATQSNSTSSVRPHTAPATRAVTFTSPSVQAYPPIHEHEEEPEELSDLYNGIHAEESVYFEGDDAELQPPSPAPRSFLQSPMPNRTVAQARPSTAAASYTPNARQQQQQQPQQSQHAQTHRDLPRSSSKHSVSSSSSYSTPPHALYDSRPSSSSSASRPISRTSAGSSTSPSPLGFLAQKALQKQQAEQETLASFSGKTLGGVAQEGVTQENKHLVGKLHYLNFNPHPHGAAAHEAQYRQSPATHHAQQQRHAPASPARTKPLQNITNSSAQRHAHSATKQTHSTPHKDVHSQQQTTARGESFVRW